MRSCIVRATVCLLIVLPLSAVQKSKEEARNRVEPMSAGGLQELPPAEGLGQNEVKNSSFENGNNGWVLGPNWSIDEKNAHEGSHSLRFDAGMSRGSIPATTE